MFLDTDDRFKPIPAETFLWVVTKTDTRWVRSELGTAVLQRNVAALRCGLDREIEIGPREAREQCGALRHVAWLVTADAGRSGVDDGGRERRSRPSG